jgi:NhaP-type Na+/H+ or K+/H+ antiporter
MTYVVVVFSIIVQGLTVPALLRKAVGDQPPESSSAH